MCVVKIVSDRWKHRDEIDIELMPEMLEEPPENWLKDLPEKAREANAKKTKKADSQTPARVSTDKKVEAAKTTSVSTDPVKSKINLLLSKKLRLNTGKNA